MPRRSNTLPRRLGEGAHRAYLSTMMIRPPPHDPSRHERRAAGDRLEEPKPAPEPKPEPKPAPEPKVALGPRHLRRR
jgi:hypothetical protein